MPSPQENGIPNSIDDDLKELATFIKSDISDENADSDLTGVLKQLERADNMARGMESRLDEILGNLDKILDGLEVAQTQRQAQTAANDVVVATTDETIRIASSPSTHSQTQASEDTPRDAS